MPNVNPEEYCIVGTTSNQDVFAFIEQAKTNESVLRGTTAGHDDAAYGLKICFDAILFEGVEKPYVFLEPLNPTTSFDFDYDTYFADYYTTA